MLDAAYIADGAALCVMLRLRVDKLGATHIGEMDMAVELGLTTRPRASTARSSRCSWGCSGRPQVHVDQAEAAAARHHQRQKFSTASVLYAVLCVRLTHFVFISLHGANGTIGKGDKQDQTTLIGVNGDLEGRHVVDAAVLCDAGCGAIFINATSPCRTASPSR